MGRHTHARTRESRQVIPRWDGPRWTPLSEPWPLIQIDYYGSYHVVVVVVQCYVDADRLLRPGEAPTHAEGDAMTGQEWNEGECCVG